MILPGFGFIKVNKSPEGVRARSFIPKFEGVLSLFSSTSKFVVPLYADFIEWVSKFVKLFPGATAAERTLLLFPTKRLLL